MSEALGGQVEFAVKSYARKYNGTNSNASKNGVYQKKSINNSSASIASEVRRTNEQIKEANTNEH